jgi:hypothetical protein
MSRFCIAYKTRDGGVALLVPVAKSGLTLEQILKKDLPADAADVEVIDASSVPSDRTFRDAWTKSGGKVDVDMEKAREVHKNHLRVRRAPLFKDLDEQSVRAIEEGDTVALAEIRQKKQALRDVTAHPAILTATTPDELKAAVPECLMIGATVNEPLVR